MRTEVRKSLIEGRGLFASESIPARRKIGELTGEWISLREARRRAKQQHRVAIWEFDRNALHLTNDIGRYINHSCSPNAFTRVIGTRIELYARKSITLGEEVTIDYGAHTHHEGRLRCRCGCVSRYL